MDLLVLSDLAPVITRPLSAISDQSWRLGEDWRKANVSPVFRRDMKENPGT